MCGIHFSLSRRAFEHPSADLVRLLQNRGPDSFKQLAVQKCHKKTISAQDLNAYLSFSSSVLSLRGEQMISQPLISPGTDSILCWNGEAWKIGDEPVSGNDSDTVFQLLLEAAACPEHPCRIGQPLSYQESRCNTQSIQRVLDVVGQISGPFAFVFFDAIHETVFFGRDFLGRRSLVRRESANGSLEISSTSEGDATAEWSEIDADGVYYMKLFPTCRYDVGSETCQDKEETALSLNKISYNPCDFSGHTSDEKELSILSLLSFNTLSPVGDAPSLTLQSPCVSLLEQYLTESLKLRIQNVRWSPDLAGAHEQKPAKIAVLFSGGLDCSVIIQVCHSLLPAEESIDLLNVAFENPRVVAAAKLSTDSSESSPYECCPDRITARRSFDELQKVCPTRHFRFIEINVPYHETLRHREIVTSLIRPHNTEMDLSIAYAFYFAARGEGTINEANSESKILYKTPARILLSGLGADEIFGGYTRHSSAFSRRGFPGLVEELELDFRRLGKRNLGRDDRVISHWGKEARFPYLDEDLLRWVLQLPVWEKCGFGQTTGDIGVDIEPGKKLLRLLAWKSGLRSVALEKKRAIQFGARAAKMERGRTKGTQLLS